MDRIILTVNGSVVYDNVGSFTTPPPSPVDPVPPPPPPPVDPRGTYPPGPVLGEGVSTWFRAGMDFFTIDSPGGSLEIVLANLSEVANLTVLYPDRSVAVPESPIIGGGGRWVRNGPPGPYSIKVESIEPGIVKYWRR